MRAKGAVAGAAAGLALLLGVACGAEQLVPVSVKVFPQYAVLTLDGAPAPRPSAPGQRVLLLRTGQHVLALSAEGYVGKTLAITVPPAAGLEVKLEREASRFLRRGSVPTGRQPKSLVFSPDGRRIFCALLEGRGVQVISADSLEVVRLLEPPAPWAAQLGFVEMAVLPGRDELWVSQMTTTMAHVFRLSDLAHIASFPTGGSWPKVITVSPDETTAFLSNWESKDVSVVDVGSRTVTARIPVGGVPRGMALSRDGRFLYVCLFDRGTVQKVDLAKRAVAQSLSFGQGAMRHVVLHPSRDVLYVSDMLRGRILELDAGRDTLRAEVRVDRNLNTITLTPDGSCLFVSSRGPNNTGDYTKKGPAFGTVSCIDTRTMQVIDWTWGRNQPTGLAVSPDGRTVAFSNFLDDEVEVYRFSPPE
jgi:YVTN family beta-propeller protein